MISKQPLDINPYEPTTATSAYPDVISFEGEIREEDYRKLLPKNEMLLLVTLAFLLLSIVLPILVAAFFFAVAEGSSATILAFIVAIFCTLLAYAFCVRMASTRRRARGYLKKFPDLLGPVKGTFNSQGLMVEDNKKTHWFPWVQLFHLVATKEGVRVPLSEDPRRFLALSAGLFTSYRQSEMEQLRIQNSTSRTTFDQLAVDSAVVFQTEVGSESYFVGWSQQPVKWGVWATLLSGPVCFVSFVAFNRDLRQWDWYHYVVVVVFLVSSVGCIRNIVQLLRSRSRVTVMVWGWLTETELIYGSGTHVMKISIASLKSLGRDAEKIQFSLPSGQSLYVFKNLFQAPNHFQKVSESFDRFIVS
jgi:hypothetical protein